MKPRVMLDTGALIALERGDQQLRKVHRLATDHGYQIVGITPVIAEWWRRGKREKQRIQILRTLVIEPPDLHVARIAGEAIGLVQATVVDALVMAAASLRGDTVYTSDLGDLERLLEVFPSVELAAV
ncbi:MAG: type II toxin-antitoxin system VapC family toxin [Deltaproteobacteria bacterium]|nr:MAG: type II toxin-antitoxin system VapC family toxin [Deltaproteobacteria bacterium]